MFNKLFFLFTSVFLLLFLTGCNEEVVVLKEVISIEMHTLPNKTTFEENEEVLVTGAKIKVNFDDDSYLIIDVTEDMVFDISLFLENEYNVTIQYVTTNQTFNTQFKIIINSDQLTIIETEPIEYFTITFNTDGGSIVDSITLSYLDPITTPANPTKEGLVFCGWYMDSYEINPYQFNQMPDYDFTLYAEWMSTDLEYELIDDTDEYMVFIEQNKDLAEVYVPRKINDKLVTKVKNSGFSDMENLTLLKLPSTIKSFGNLAFYFLSNLEEIYIPKDLETIENTTFMYSFSVINYVVDPLNSHFKAVDGVLYSFDLETLIRYPIGRIDQKEYTLLSSTKTIFPYAFSSIYDLNSVILNDGLKKISTHAFFDANGLLEISIPNSVETIELYAFRSAMNLSKVELGTGLSEIEAYVFNGCGSLIEIILPPNIAYLRYGAFYGSHQLKRLIILRPTSMGLVQGGLFMLTDTSSQLKILVVDQLAVGLYGEADFWKSYKTKIEVYIP